MQDGRNALFAVVYKDFFYMDNMFEDSLTCVKYFFENGINPNIQDIVIIRQ